MENTTGTQLARIVVNQPFADAVGPAALMQWAKILATTASERGTDDASTVGATLQARFTAAELDVSPVELERLGERLADPDVDGIVVETHDGRVLASSGAGSIPPSTAPSPDADTPDAGEQVEPSDPDRPFWS